MVIPASSAPSETNWRVRIQADDGFGGGFGPAAQMGVTADSVDGYDTQDVAASYYVDIPHTTRWVAGLLPGDTTTTYLRNIKSAAPPSSYPQSRKIWDFRVGAQTDASSLPMRLQMRSTSVNPLGIAGGLPFIFELVMIDNKGMLGAAPNGTRWSVPIPTGVSGTYFWSMDTALDQNGILWGNLPILKLSDNTHAAMLAEGYQMQFIQTAVPEPSSALALSAGLLGLMGFARRRRR
jgi:hypothetical protein